MPLADSDDGNISALAAYQDGSSVGALVSIDVDPESDPSGEDNELWQEIDNPPAVAFGQPPLLVGPDPLPSTGFLLRQTATGWTDEELDDFPNALQCGAENCDLPGRPDPVLAMWTDPSGQQGWAVGGQTGGEELQLNGAGGAAAAVQTAGVMRFGAGPNPPVSADASIPIPAGEPTFAFGGGSGCVLSCSADDGQDLGPNAWLEGAIASANRISGLRAFLYAGEPLGSPASALPAAEFDRELASYASALSSGGSLPVYTEATSQSVTAAAGGSSGFAQVLGAHAPAGSTPSGTPVPPAGTAAYAFNSSATGRTVRVIVLDYSSGSLSGSGGAQLSWLEAELGSAKQAGIPAIVVGGDDITDSNQPNYASDAGAVSAALLSGGASAYLFYDISGQNVSETLGTGSNTIPVYGTGTLGYVSPPITAPEVADFLGASGYLLVSVHPAQRNASTNRAPVTAQLIPNAGQLGLDAVDGTLLRRSTVSLLLLIPSRSKSRSPGNPPRA